MNVQIICEFSLKQSSCSVTLCFVLYFFVLLHSEVLPLACPSTSFFLFKKKKQNFSTKEEGLKSGWYVFIFTEHETRVDNLWSQSHPLSGTVQRKGIRLHLDRICFTCHAPSLYCWLFRHEAKTLPRSTFTH